MSASIRIVLLALLAASHGCAGRGCGSARKSAENVAIAADAGAAAAALVALSGQVTDDAGRGLARVRVLALGVDGRGLALTDSGADGRWSLAVPAGPVHVETRMSGRVSRALDVTAPGQVATVALAPAVELRGRLHDADDRAIASALVAARAETSWLPKQSRPPAPALGVWRDAELATARTGPDGGFVIGGIASGFFKLTAQAEGFSPVDVRHVIAPGDGVSIALARTVLMAGTVVDASGAPAAGATVEVAGSGLWPPKLATTDGKGAFVVEGLIEGIYEVRARRGEHEASPPLEGVERFGAEAARAGGADIALRLAPARPLEGRVVDAATGAALAGARVAIATDTLAALADRVETGPDGSWRTPPLPPGRYVASASALDHLPIWGERVTVPADAPATVELRLPRGAELDGIVKDSAGAPVAGAKIELVTESASGLLVPVSLATEQSRTEVWNATDPQSPKARLKPSGELGVLAGPIPFPPPRARAGAGAGTGSGSGTGPSASAFTTGADGRFHVAGIPPGKVRVVASHPDHAEAAGAELTLAAGAQATEVILILRRGAELVGRVTSDDGAPLPNVLVTATIVGAAAPRADAMTDDDQDDDGEAAAGLATGTVALTDAEGRYRLGGRLQGRVRVEASLQGYLSAQRTVRIAAELAETGGEVSADLTLVRADRELVGAVVDALGFPVAGAHIVLTGKRVGKSPPMTDSDPSGRFVLARLPPPPWQLAVSHPDHPPRTARVDSDRDRPELVLAFGGGVSGRVTDGRTRAAVTGVRVVFTGPNQQTVTARPDARGEFSVLALAAGAWTVTASAPRYVAASRALAVAAGDRGPREITVTDVVLELFRAGRISGRVIDDHGDPVSGATVTVSPSAGSTTAQPASLPRATSDAGGSFVLELVAEGDWDVVASWSAGKRSAPESVRLREGDDVSGVLLRPR